jgi:Ca-activated chloride channel family protein
MISVVWAGGALVLLYNKRNQSNKLMTWQHLWNRSGAMKRGSLILILTLAAGILSFGSHATAQQPTVTFRSGVALVPVNAVVRDKKGRFVPDLTAGDFTVLDNGVAQPISDFKHDLTGVSLALLFDVSGSMEARLGDAREAAAHLLAWLEATRDEAAIYTFDTELDEVEPYTHGLTALPQRLSSVRPFGATSLNDAIAAAARKSAERDAWRRAVVVFTDGNDNWSRLSPTDVAALASAVDVPVYIVGVVPGIDNPTADNSTISAERSALAGSMTDLATWTGGHAFIVSTPADRSAAARQIIDELRHQYLITIESSGKPGWHPLAVHMKSKDLVVRARSGYFAGQSRPIS